MIMLKIFKRKSVDSNKEKRKQLFEKTAKVITKDRAERKEVIKKGD